MTTPGVVAEPVAVQRSPLRIGAVDDPAEVEAEAVAEQVLRMPEPGPALLQRCPGGCPDEEVLRRPLKHAEEADLEVRPLSADVATSEPLASAIGAARAGGASLPGATLRFFEPRFGLDLSGVTIHRDERAADLAASVNARAFTVGRDIFFGSGQWAPGTDHGGHLLAHELTHTVQQSGREVRDSRSGTTRPHRPVPTVQRALTDLGPHCTGRAEFLQSALGMPDAQVPDSLTCVCFLAGLADLVDVAFGPAAIPIEMLDCVCNLLTTVQEFWIRGSDGGCFSVSNLSAVDIGALTVLAGATLADCLSLPIGAAVGSLLFGSAGATGGAAGGGSAGGPPGAATGGLFSGVVSAATGAVIGDSIVDIAAMALQNAITQGTPLPVGQCEACLRSITGGSPLFGIDCSAMGTAPGRPE